MHAAVLALLASAAMAVAVAANPATAADPRSEIESLIAALGSSRCAFERNGRRHDAAEAQAHLRRKYVALLRRMPEATADRFIAHVATKSSVSGRPYRVHCPNRPVAESAPWFRERLQALRDAR